MPVNTAALKTFAPAMRRQLLEAVGRKLDLLLNSQTPDTLSTYAKQIAELRKQEAKNREQLLERVAYTWFNRLCALRYLDAKGWHPFGSKVLMPAAEGENQPELLKIMRAGSLPGELKTHTNEARLHGLLDGQIPPAIAGSDPQGEVYRELVLAACRSFHNLLPDLFEGLDDASELLLPDDLLTEGSIAGIFRSSISDSDCDDVEIIGWLYQFYISEKKDKVIGKVVKSEDIPAATQLFTPNWIVKYMVQNTIGAQWLATYPNSPLREQMEFYIEPAEQTDEVKAKLKQITPTSLNPEELTLMDPACGSGHILVEAYEVFKAIYLEQGFQLREIPKLILEKNLFGLDIDKRAAQLTSFALLMQGRSDDRRLFDRGIKLNVMALEDSTEFDAEGLAQQISLQDYDLKLDDLSELKRLFENAATCGSLIKVPEGLAEKLPSLIQLSTAPSQDLFVSEEIKSLKKLVNLAKLLEIQYDAVVANPPYMGSKSFCPYLKSWMKTAYPGCDRDLFSAFVMRILAFTKKSGAAGVMTSFVWMFITTFEEFRKRVLAHYLLSSLVQLHYDAFADAKAHVCTYIIQKRRINDYKSSFVRLAEFPGVSEQGPRTLEAIRNRSCSWFYESKQDEFDKIPGSPVAYWVSKNVLKVFEGGTPLGELIEAKVGLQTGDNDRFLRRWAEVSLAKIGIGMQDRAEAKNSGYKWFPYNKGGAFRKWYGNREYLLNWEDDGREITSILPRSVIRNPDFYFHPSVSWSDITSGPGSFRVFENGFIHDTAGMSAFGFDTVHRSLVVAYCNTPIAVSISRMINPTLHFNSGNFAAIPFLHGRSDFNVQDVKYRADCLVDMCMSDWDAYEYSWDFQSLPVLTTSPDASTNLESSYTSWITQNRDIIAEMKRLEEENNRLFVVAYGLGDELTPDVPIEQITLTVNPAYRYGGDGSDEEKWGRFQRDSMAELLSYATGCMMGRYSLDHPGLILADSRNNQEEQLVAYKAKIGKPIAEIQFKPDPDGIIPVLDGEWFEDDIVARTREFLEVTFPESTVTENLRFIEDSLGKDIRKYFCSEFYKDHLQTYKKRPIYWMVQSPKKGFACLIYLHRYTKDTLNQVLNNYFRPYLQKLEARLAQLGLDQLNDSLPTRERTAARKEADKITKVLKECQAWEQDALLPLAQQRMELDLDDGVKVNYLKLQDVLAPIPGLAAKED